MVIYSKVKARYNFSFVLFCIRIEDIEFCSVICQGESGLIQSTLIDLINRIFFIDHSFLLHLHFDNESELRPLKQRVKCSDLCSSFLDEIYCYFLYKFVGVR